MDKENESVITREIANALFGYFDTLYNLNRNLIMLCGLDIVENSGQYEKIAEYVIINAPRLIPYKYDKKNKKTLLRRMTACWNLRMSFLFCMMNIAQFFRIMTHF